MHQACGGVPVLSGASARLLAGLSAQFVREGELLWFRILMRSLAARLVQRPR